MQARAAGLDGDDVETGVGAGRGEFLKANDRLDLWIEGIGTLTHTMG